MEYSIKILIISIFMIIANLFAIDRNYAGGTDTEKKQTEATISIPGRKEHDESRTLIKSFESEYFSLYPENKPDQTFYIDNTMKTITVISYGVIESTQQDAVKNIISKIKGIQSINRSIIIQFFEKENFIKTKWGRERSNEVLLKQLEIE